MKYIYIVSDIINTRQTPTERYCIAERIPCDVDILHFLNHSGRAGKVLHAYTCGTWAEAQKLAEEWNNENRH